MSADTNLATTLSREELGALLSSAREEFAGSQKSLRSIGMVEAGRGELAEIARRFGLEQGRSLSTLHQTLIRFRFSHWEEINLRQFASAMLATDRVARVDLGIGSEDVYILLNRSLVFGWMMLAFGARPGRDHDPIPSRPYTRIEERFLGRAVENITETFAKDFSAAAAGQTSTLSLDDPAALYTRSKRPYRVISLEVDGFGEAGLLRIALPLSLMDEAQTDSSPLLGAGPAPGELACQIYETPVQVHVELGFAELPLSDLARLAVGDELTLQRSATDGLVFKVEDAPKFQAEPGKIGNRLAVRITNEIQS